MRIQRTRSAFTIVEMLVATALILFIMAIISQIFASASKTYSALRTAGELQERLRQGAVVMRRDLATEHFSGPFIPGRSGPRLGDQRLDLAGWVPPHRGYFEVRQLGNPPVIVEPIANPVSDGESLYSTRADTHVMRFTVHLPDLPSAELYCTAAPPAIVNDPDVNAFPPSPPALIGDGLCYSRWAEVVYFLWPNGDVTTQTANPSLTRYSLRRRIRLLAPQSKPVGGVMNQAQAAQLVISYPELALKAVQLPPPNVGQYIVMFMGPEAVTDPQNRVAAPQPAAPIQKLGPNGLYETGDDILITDVLSMEIKLAWIDNQTFNAITPGSSPQSSPMFIAAQPGTTVNSDAPFDNVPQVPAALATNPSLAGQRIFDTWYQAPTSDGIDWDKPGGTQGFLTQGIDRPPLRINVRSIQIKLRVWDPKAEQARQVTLVQEM
jgi:hypothetical protein